MSGGRRHWGKHTAFRVLMSLLLCASFISIALEYHDEDPAAFSPAGMRVPIVYFDEGFDISVSKQAEPSPSGELKLCLPTAMRPKPEARSLPSAACSTNVLLDMFLKK